MFLHYCYYGVSEIMIIVLFLCAILILSTINFIIIFTLSVFYLLLHWKVLSELIILPVVSFGLFFSGTSVIDLGSFHRVPGGDTWNIRVLAFY